MNFDQLATPTGSFPRPRLGFWICTFPSMKGLSAPNLKYMRFFAEHCPDRQFVQQSAAQFPQPPIRPTLSDELPWFHIVAEYQLVRALSEPLDTHLPSIEEIEAELSRDLEGGAQP